MTRKYFIILCLLCLSLFAFAESEVDFNAQAPKAVVVGKPFQLVYSLNQKGKDLRAPVLNNFEILAGPYVSSRSNYTFDNGKSVSSLVINYTYTLLAKKEGEFDIPGATIVVKRKKVRSNSLHIKVLPPDKTSNQSENTGNSSNTNSITNDNLFIRAIVSRRKVFEKEAIVLTYRLYTVVNLVGVPKIHYPDFKGFVVHEIELPDSKPWTQEHYKGRNYKVADMRKVLLFPQSAGNFNIEPFTGEAVVRIRTSRGGGGSLFDSFYDSYQDVHKEIQSNGLKLKSLALPLPQPEDYNGGVGQFSIASSLSSTELKQNESLTFKLTLKGKGNLKIMQVPKIKFPADFEVYDPKISTKITNTQNGQKGSKTVEYLIIPRHNGDFVVPSVPFSYFDPSTKTYKHLQTKSYTLKVLKGDASEDNVENSTAIGSSYTNQQDVEELGTDIRYIHAKMDEIIEQEEPFAGTGKYWLSYLIPLFMALLLLIFFRKQARENADVALSRNKRANKVARKRLKLAAKAMKKGDKDLYYDEILKALWDYLCDKLTLPLAQLNKENVETQLTTHKVKKEIIEQFIKLLNQCEFERYAPMQDTQSAMDLIYDKTLKMITKLDQTIKK